MSSPRSVTATGRPAPRTPLGARQASRPGTANAALPTLPPQKVNAEQRVKSKKKCRGGSARERPRPKRPQAPIPWNRSTACPSYDSTLVTMDADLWCNPRFRAPMPRRRLQSKKAAVRPKSAPAAPYRPRGPPADPRDKSLPSRRDGLASFRPTVGGVRYADADTGGSVYSRERSWNRSTEQPRRPEPQLCSHPGQVNHYNKRVDTRAYHTSVDEIVFGRDTDGSGAVHDAHGKGVHLQAATMRAL